METPNVTRVLPEDLRASLARGETVLVVDVRTEDARAAHPYEIPGARWLPLPSVVERAETLPRQGTIAFYCT